MEALGRFELPTCGLGNRRSIHLSYRALEWSQSSVYHLLQHWNFHENTVKAAIVNVCGVAERQASQLKTTFGDICMIRLKIGFRTRNMRMHFITVENESEGNS